MKRAIDGYVFTVTVNEPNREYEVKLGLEQLFTRATLLDALNAIFENTTNATSYVVTIVHHVELMEEGCVTHTE